MRTESQIKKRLDQLLWKYLRARYVLRLTRRGCNCRRFMERALASGEKKGFCVVQGEDGHAQGDMCAFEDEAVACPIYEPLMTKDDVKQEFKSDLVRPLWKHHHMKDVIQLEWVLGLSPEDAGDMESRFVDEFLAWVESNRKVKESFWKRVIGWFLGKKFRWGVRREST